MRKPMAIGIRAKNTTMVFIGLKQSSSEIYPVINDRKLYLAGHGATALNCRKTFPFVMQSPAKTHLNHTYLV
jgi:hypothetical protein